MLSGALTAFFMQSCLKF